MPKLEVTIICETEELDQLAPLIAQLQAFVGPGVVVQPEIKAGVAPPPTPPPSSGSNGADPASAKAAAAPAAPAKNKGGRPPKAAAAPPAAPPAAPDPDDDPLGDLAGPADPDDQDGDALGLAQPSLSPAEAHEKGMNMARELYGKGHKAEVKGLQKAMGIAKFTDIPVSEGHKFYKLAADACQKVGVQL